MMKKIAVKLLELTTTVRIEKLRNILLHSIFLYALASLSLGTNATAAECVAAPPVNPPTTDSPSNILAPGDVNPFVSNGNEIVVSNENELLSAIASANPGDVITVLSGSYSFGHRINLIANGTGAQPITIRANMPRSTQLTFSQSSGIVEGFVVTGNSWIIDGFVITSDCTSSQHSRCEHAIHIKSGAQNLWVRNNQIMDFNSAIKGSGSNNQYANNVRIEHNEIFNNTVRMTSNPATPIDINGGDSWRIYKNHIHDFAKGQGNMISYGAFLKANSSNGLFDSNLVQCTKNVFSQGARVGLSFGGGGNSPINSPICKDADCSQLHRNGRMTNNFITDCSDVGIYINASSNIEIDHNTLYQTTGIDVRFDTSTASIVKNILVGGSIRERNNGTVTENQSNTIVSTDSISSVFDLVDVTQIVSADGSTPTVDICGYERQDDYTGALGGNASNRESCLGILY